MGQLNWLLGTFGVLAWLIPVLWFYRHDLRRAWRERGSSWFRDDRF